MNPLTARYKKRSTLVAVFVNLFLGISKVVCGVLGQSEALIADGIHSFSDLLTDILTLIAIKLGSKSADKEHPYGHARFETLATVLLGISLIMVAGGLIWDAVERLKQGTTLLNPGVLALSVALLSIVVNELLFQYTAAVAKQTRSNLIKANAWHHRSDAISSLVVVIGVLGSMSGYSISDAVAAIFVGLMVVKVGLNLILDSTRELVDSSLPEARVTEIRESILSTDGIKALHFLRTRRMGADALVDVHVLVDSDISVSEGHLIGDTMRFKLMREFEEISDVLVHVDPEDDEKVDFNVELPLRNEILTSINRCWENIEAAAYIEKINLHYLKGKVEIEVILPRSVLSIPTMGDNLEQQFAIAEKKLDFVSHVRVYYDENSRNAAQERRT